MAIKALFVVSVSAAANRPSAAGRNTYHTDPKPWPGSPGWSVAPMSVPLTVDAIGAADSKASLAGGGGGVSVWAAAAAGSTAAITVAIAMRVLVRICALLLPGAGSVLALSTGLSRCH